MSKHNQKSLALLIPGLDGTGLLYYRQIEGLAARHRVLPWAFHCGPRFGFGDLIGALGLATADEPPGSIVVIGESFGGTVAMHYALAFPERVEKLVLINTFPRYRQRIRIRLACGFAPLLGLGGIRHLKNLIIERVLAREGILPGDRARYREIIESVDPIAYRRRLELVRDVDLTARLSAISVPVLVFASGRDKIVPSREEARLMVSLIPRAILHEFPHAGHALLLTPGFSLANYL